MSVRQEKDTLRRKYLRFRKSLSAEQKAVMDASVTDQLLQSSAYLSAQTVFCYVSLPHEIDTKPIFFDAWRRGKRIAAPRCRENGRMEFYVVSSFEDLESGTMGISEPKQSCPLAIPQMNDLCVVPCLAMDANGNRLGYGGGFYDRYLSRYQVCSVTLCYKICVAERIPAETFDVRIQTFITDKEV